MPRKPSGAANRRAARDAANDDSQFDGEGGSARFRILGEPDFKDPEHALEYTRLYLLESLYQIGNDDSFKARDRHRMLKDTAIAIGATHPRANLEAKFRQAEKLLEKARHEKQGDPKPSPVSVERSATARQYSQPKDTPND